jgi:hypothetical protein
MVANDFNGYTDLAVVGGGWVEARDGGLEGIAPAHINEQGYRLILSVGEIS